MTSLSKNLQDQLNKQKDIVKGLQNLNISDNQVNKETVSETKVDDTSANK